MAAPKQKVTKSRRRIRRNNKRRISNAQITSHIIFNIGHTSNEKLQIDFFDKWRKI